MQTDIPPQGRRQPQAGPLVNGDCLNAMDFLFRCQDLPKVRTAELIEGIVYVDRLAGRGESKTKADLLQRWLEAYSSATPGTVVAANTRILIDRENVAQPSGMLRILPECGGQTRTTPEGLLAEAPELIAEISTARACADSRDKFTAFRRNCVREFVIWWTFERQLDWFCLDGGSYVLNHPNSNRVLHSRVFPGLSLNLTAWLGQDAPALLKTLHAGLKSPEHTAFVAQLEQRKRSR